VHQTGAVPVVNRPDIDLYYERHGAGRPLLMCNGSGATIEASAPLITKLAEHSEVLVHDQRCLGRSGIPATTPTMADYAADALAVADAAGWDRFALFGISFGGMVAQELAVTHPDRIERLALLCTSPGGAGGSSYPLHTLAALPPDERFAISLRNLDSRFDDAWLAEHPFDAMIVDGMRARQADDKPDHVRRGEAMQLEARSHHDVWDRLPAITCPTLIMGGEYDGTAPIANSEAIHSRIAGSELRRYEGGHLFVYQDRRAFPDLVEFLTS
jgi:3-oxoadipate enol-lactonase